MTELPPVYIEKSTATIDQLQPGVRLYFQGGHITVVAEIHEGRKYSARWASSVWELDQVVRHGLEMGEWWATRIFPVLKETGLTCRRSGSERNSRI